MRQLKNKVQALIDVENIAPQTAPYFLDGPYPKRIGDETWIRLASSDYRFPIRRGESHPSRRCIWPEVARGVFMKALCRIRREPNYRRQAFEKGLQRVGFKIVDSGKPSGPEDWLILWNRKRGGDENEANAWEKAGGTVIVAENGYLAQVDKTYYAISVHGHNGSGWIPVEDENRFKLLGFPIKLWRKQGTEVIVRGQRGIGSTLMASPASWGRSTVAKLGRKHTGAIRLVDHPGDKNKYSIDAAALKHASAVVIWSSALGVRALTEGIPVFYDAPHWICSKGAHDLGKFPTPLRDDGARLKALHKMSHGQWHFNEIATGEPFARIITHRGEAKW